MKVLVLGSGGREHAIVWKLRQSPSVQKLYCAPGNAGIEECASTVPIKATDLDGLLRFAEDNKIDLTVVGPEQPLVMGIVDLFERHGLSIFGPTKAAAQLEGSKVFSKRFMSQHRIPTARYESFSATEQLRAKEFAGTLSFPVVVKADGLAAGKGVLICETRRLAEQAVDSFLVEKIFGNAGERIVIEEFLHGEEASVFVLTDGSKFALLSPAQDHKRILDGDMGKNTGGMGAYAPAPVITRELQETVVRDIVVPTLEGMREEGTPYTGCLYVGLMLTEGGPKVLEYNCRFGDPEAQVVIPLIDGDFAEILYSVAAKRLNPAVVRHRAGSAVCVVMASKGYPDDHATGVRIQGLDEVKHVDGVVAFHAGTKRDSEGVVTAGGRVLSVTAIGRSNDIAVTIRQAYRAVESISFDGAYYRTDIGKKALQPVNAVS